MGAFVTVLAERSGLCVLVRDGTEKMKIIAGIPAHNNKKCIGSLLLGVKKQVDEIIVVDDGSTDDTVEIVEECGKILKGKNNSSFGKAFLKPFCKQKPLRKNASQKKRFVIKQENTGEGVAIRRLIEEAKNRGADILVIIEANCEYNPGDIPKILAPILNVDADLVLGSRFIGDNKGENKKKMLLARLFWAKLHNFVANLGATVKVSDSQSGLRALSRYAMDTIRLKGDGDAVKSEMVIEAVKQMIRIKEVGIGIWSDGEICGGYD
jgi:glycosyltransferase involved in cell wall biosynthesis